MSQSYLDTHEKIECGEAVKICEVHTEALRPFDSNPIHFNDSSALELSGLSGRTLHGIGGISLTLADMFRVTDTFGGHPFKGMPTGYDTPPEVTSLFSRFIKPMFIGDEMCPRFAWTSKGADFNFSNLNDFHDEAIEGVVKLGKRRDVSETSEGLTAKKRFFERFRTPIYNQKQNNPLKNGSFHITPADVTKPEEDRPLNRPIITGLSKILPMAYISGVLGTKYPGAGTIWLKQHGEFFARLPTQNSINPYVEIAVDKVEKRKEGLECELTTNVFDTSPGPENAIPMYFGRATVLVRT